MMRTLLLVVLLALWPGVGHAQEWHPAREVAEDTAACLSDHVFRSLNGPAWTEDGPRGYRVVWRPIEPDTTQPLYEWIDLWSMRNAEPRYPDPMTERWWPRGEYGIYAIHGGTWDPQLAMHAFACMDESISR